MRQKKILGPRVCFLNSQIFFNPKEKEQKNYWHRDIQYTGAFEEFQKNTIEQCQTSVLHFRLAFADELGIELIPESHCRWDSPEELAVRLQRNQKKVYDSLLGSQRVSLKKGDLLAFDANIIHRGLYGGERFAFDILFCQPLPEVLKFVNKEVYPKTEELDRIECPEIFNF